jgi:hypothetical protein
VGISGSPVLGLAVAGMTCVCRPQVLHADVGVNLRGADVCVTKDGLDGTKISPAVQQSRRANPQCFLAATGAQCDANHRRTLFPPVNFGNFFVHDFRQVKSGGQP